MGRALSIMNQYHHVKKQDLSDEQLHEFLLEYYPLALEALDLNADMTTAYEAHMDGLKPSSLTNWGYAEQQCRNAVQSARGHWREDVYLEVQRRAREQGSRGGRAYKTYTLDSHLSTAHLGATAAASALGVSRRTIYNMRQEFADVDLSTGEVHGEEEPTEEAPLVESVESVRLRREAREGVQHSVDGLAGDDANRSTRQDPLANCPPRLAESAGGVLLGLTTVILPY